MTKQLTRLNARHKEMASYQVTNPMVSNQQLADKFHFTHCQVSRIVHSKLYQDYVDQLMKEAWKDATKIAQDTMITLAAHGDRQAAQYILDCNGYKPREQVDIELGNTINIKIE